ncbi:MAG: CPXCG motif-containing cysteine-rich protein [Epsilonproteobacteria bacterium]|nr:CPXCG motif-containing cysteine-rich protein [Campylobacterota bacterium]
MLEHFFTCPYCWERISMLLDPDMSEEAYIEDCQVCCNPIQIQFTMIDDKLIRFESIKLQ